MIQGSCEKDIYTISRRMQPGGDDFMISGMNFLLCVLIVICRLKYKIRIHDDYMNISGMFFLCIMACIISRMLHLTQLKLYISGDNSTSLILKLARAQTESRLYGMTTFRSFTPFIVDLA